jgi:hypothetical protein
MRLSGERGGAVPGGKLRASSGSAWGSRFESVGGPPCDGLEAAKQIHPAYWGRVDTSASHLASSRVRSADEPYLAKS